jgi:hypothetical protein
MENLHRLYDEDEGETLDLEVHRKRKGKLVQGAISLIRVIEPFTIEEVRERGNRGVPTPLDLMPHEFWWPDDLPFPRFGEEMLGKDF